MLRATRNLVPAAAAFALALASALAAASQTQQQPAPAKCATAAVRLSSATPKPGEELLATVAVQSCAAVRERVVIRYSYTDPCGNKVEMGTAPVRLAPGEKQEATINFLAPSVAECAGDFTMSAAVVADGEELNSASATFKVSAH